MDRRQRRRSAKVLSIIVLFLGCAAPASVPHPVRDLTVRAVRPLDRGDRRHARAIAAKVAAGARSSEPEERRPDLVADRVAVKITADGNAVIRQVGEASWYGDWHHGRPTASGAPFDQHALTAAHPTLPLGTKATVTNLETGASVEVLVNDRGPYVYGRDIDLSRAAAHAIGVVHAGAAAVRIEVMVDSGPAQHAGRRPRERHAPG